MVIVVRKKTLPVTIRARPKSLTRVLVRQVTLSSHEQLPFAIVPVEVAKICWLDRVVRATVLPSFSVVAAFLRAMIEQ